MHYTIKKAIGTILLLVAALLGGAEMAYAAIINVPADQPTISAAVAAAVAGDEIVVAPGTYNENVTVNKSLIIRSSGGRGVTTVNGSGGGGVLGTFLITADNVTIGGFGQGFTINGYDNANPGIEYAAIYIQGVRSNITIRGNDVAANGEGGLLSEFGNAVTNLVVNGNIFSGKTFVGPQAGDCGFANQFTAANVPRQLVAIPTGTGVVFTSNQITGTSGSSSSIVPCTTTGQGNTLVTIDANNVTIRGNNFAGTTTRFGSSLRVRGTNVSVYCNTFNNAGLAPTCTHIAFDATSIANLGTPNTVAGIAAQNTFVNEGAYLNPLGASLNIFRDNAQATAVATAAGIGQAVVAANTTVLANVTNTNTGESFCSIQSAIDDPNTLNGHTISVAAGTYNEDVNVTKSLTLTGAGCGNSFVIGPIGGAGATFSINATGVIIEGFTITRAGNNPADWNNAGLNSAGISIAAAGVAEVRNNCIVGNRTGIDINNSSGNNVHNNFVDNNRTGMIFRNTTDNTRVENNFITNNWTVGILFLDASGGSNAPVQSALNSTFSNNNISGNWYGQIVDRQAGGSLPAPGTTNLKGFTCNWYGVLDPVVSTANSAEPGYAALIPVAFGGAAVPPGGQPDIAGPASANFLFQPFLNTGTDDEPGTFGFQPIPGSCVACAIAFTTCPTPIVTNTDPNKCEAVVTYTVAATGLPAPTLSYAFVGATTMNGLGSGSGSSFAKGVTVVTITASTPCGSETCTFTVTVNDNQLPTIACPNNIIRPNDLSKCGAAVNYPMPITNDNCEVLSTSLLNNSLPPNSLFPVGTSTVTWQVKDASGNATTCAFTVTVNDTELPKVTCPANINKWTAPGRCDALIAFALKGMSDNCTSLMSSYVVSPTATLQSGQNWPLGTYTVTYTVKDAAMNATNCSFTVKVTDGQAPSITCPPNQTKNTDADLCTAVVTYFVTTLTDNCSSVFYSAVNPAHQSGNAFPKGVTTVVLRATDAALLTSTCTFRVTVNDRQKPALSCPADQAVSTGAGICTANVIYATPNFTDNCAPTSGAAVRISGPASGSAFPKGMTNVIFKATDASGNFSLCTIKVTVTDNEKPKITCPDSQTKNADPGKCTAVTTYNAPTSTDNCPGVIQQLVSGLASGSVFPKGTTTVRWQARDLAGLTETCEFTVTVNDNQLPILACPPNTTVQGSGTPCTYPKSQLISAVASDNCGLTSLSSDAPANLPLGPTLVTWTANDGTGSTTCAHTVTVTCGSTPNVGGRASEIEMTMMPNPASEQVLVSITGVSERGAELSVYDALGRRVWRKTITSEINQIALDVTGKEFANGMYQLSLRTEDSVITKSLVIQR